MKLLLEIRAAEGGDDAKLLVEKQASIYQNYCAKHNLHVETIAESRAACG
jgi:protein subunit release factor A